MFKRSLVLAFALFAASAQEASAATFDFAALATPPPGPQGGGEGFWNTQITTPGHVYTVGFVGVVASATGNTNAFSGAYLDAPDAAGPAGLGVCSTSGGCEGTNDDNVGRIGDTTGALTETLRLTFTTPVKLTDLFFRNSDHGVFVGSLMINGILFTTSATGELTSADLAALSFATMFDFFSLPGDANRIAKDFYVSGATVSPIPLPAALPLFGTGLAGLGLLGWRRKKKAIDA
jgi:hypothetical protein